MKTGTFLEHPIRTKQNRVVRTIGRLLRKLLAVIAALGAAYICVMVPRDALLAAEIEGPLWWALITSSIAALLATAILIGLPIDNFLQARDNNLEGDK